MIYDRDPTLRPSASPYVPEDSGVELAGTKGSPVVSDRFKFKSAPDSNVSVEVKPGRVPEIEVGVYYV